MNKDNAKDYLPFVQALADGKTIQIKLNWDHQWRDLGEVDFFEPLENYRIKPEQMEIWVNVYPDGNLVAHESRKNAEKFITARDITTKHFREVIE